MKGDVQHSYIMKGKTYYEFIVEMDNGDKGRASAMSNSFRFKQGDDVVYEHVPDEQHGDRLRAFSAADQPQQQQPQQSSAPSGTPQQAQARPDRYKEDPDKSRKIIAQSSLGNAVDWVLGQPEDLEGTPDKEKKRTSKIVLEVARVFENWIYDSIKRHPENK